MNARIVVCVVTCLALCCFMAAGRLSARSAAISVLGWVSLVLCLFLTSCGRDAAGGSTYDLVDAGYYVDAGCVIPPEVTDCLRAEAPDTTATTKCCRIPPVTTCGICEGTP